jgi:2-aminoethylphosphonate transport system permease protein
MLIWTRRGRVLTRLLFGVVVVVLLVAPVLVVVLAAFASQWNSLLPSGFTLAQLRAALAADNLASLFVSVQTAVLAGAIAVVTGTTAALSAALLPRRLRRIADLVFHLPIAVPSVVVGLGLLVAFSQRPILLNGTVGIVVIAQSVLVFAFAYSTVAAAVQRTDEALPRVAASLGAAPARVLFRVRLPLLLPTIAAAASLSIALCMGELGATIMIYPPSWRTLPVTVFALADRGQTFLAGADTLVLLVTTFLVLLVVTGAGTARWRRRTG